MRFSKIVKMFESGGVAVCGQRGTGKDVLIGNVIARRPAHYVSNCDYTQDERFHPFVYDDFDIGCTYKDLIEGNYPRYVYPFPKGTDLYLSDVGVYFPSQYNGELNRDYKNIPVFTSLSRHLARGSVHYNCQNFARCWDKIREQVDTYLYCRKCIFIGNIVVQFITEYERGDTCQNRIKPCSYSIPLFADKETRQRAKMYLDNFDNVNGRIRNHILVYKNKSKHNTYFFEEAFRNAQETA